MAKKKRTSRSRRTSTSTGRKKKTATGRKKKTTAGRKKKTATSRGMSAGYRALRKKALLIGVNKYQMPGADLRGCVNDVLNIEGTIKKYCGFTAGNIKKLVDAKATTRNIRDGIEALTDDARIGDVLFLHYSGHGSNVPDKNGDEADNRDEILCPTDLDWGNPLLDDWLREVFESLPGGVNLSVVFDCCHSGSATRAFHPPDAPILPRYLPCPLDLMATESGRSLRGKPRGHAARRSRRRSAGRSRDVTELKTPEVLISGCRDDQTSADAHIRGSYNGALTYHLVKAIAATRGKATYRKLHAEAARLVKKGRYTQVPQLSGKKLNLDWPFLQPYV